MLKRIKMTDKQKPNFWGKEMLISLLYFFFQTHPKNI